MIEIDIFINMMNNMQPNVGKNERWKKIPKWQMNQILSTTDRIPPPIISSSQIMEG
jgi:hypothetical protein